LNSNIISVDGLHAYTHNRGVLFNLTACYSVKIRGVTLQAAVPNLGTVGLFNFVNCVDVDVANFSEYGNSLVTSAATSGTTTGLINDTGQAFPVNQYIGYIAYNVTRNGSSTIASNTATSLTLSGTITGQTTGDTYQILWPGSTLLGVGGLATAITLTGTQASFSNGTINGANIGILTQGAGALDVNFDQVHVTQTFQNAYQNLTTGGTPSGRIKASNCNWSDSWNQLVSFTNVATYDFFLDNCRILNAGLSGSVSQRNFSPATSGLTKISDCVIGQNNASAAAVYYIDAASTGQVVFIDPIFVGAPPTAIQNPSATNLSSIGRLALTYSASITPDVGVSDTFEITATNSTAFTINAPLKPMDGKKISITIRNTSGGALGAITWNAVFKMSAFTSPATANSRAVGFFFDGTNWVQTFLQSVDVPN
jgi:hypothetical protein